MCVCVSVYERDSEKRGKGDVIIYVSTMRTKTYDYSTITPIQYTKSLNNPSGVRTQIGVTTVIQFITLNALNSHNNPKNSDYPNTSMSPTIPNDL